jgi:zinc transport system ATP-binding protein
VASGLVATGGLLRRGNAAGRARVAEVLAQAGMEAHAGRRIGALSVGQQQRVLIARALVTQPELLILDEPTGGVDPEAQTSFHALLHHLNREREVTLILVSHDIGWSPEVTSCVSEPRLIFSGPGRLPSDAALTALRSSVRVVSHQH